MLTVTGWPTGRCNSCSHMTYVARVHMSRVKPAPWRNSPDSAQLNNTGARNGNRIDCLRFTCAPFCAPCYSCGVEKPAPTVRCF